MTGFIPVYDSLKPFALQVEYPDRRGQQCATKRFRVELLSVLNSYQRRDSSSRLDR